eukprot:jgi/Psemu1/16564/gm1.16564_g
MQDNTRNNPNNVRITLQQGGPTRSLLLVSTEARPDAPATTRYITGPTTTRLLVVLRVSSNTTTEVSPKEGRKALPTWCLGRLSTRITTSQRIATASTRPDMPTTTTTTTSADNPPTEARPDAPTTTRKLVVVQVDAALLSNKVASSQRSRIIPAITPTWTTTTSLLPSLKGHPHTEMLHQAHNNKVWCFLPPFEFLQAFQAGPAPSSHPPPTTRARSTVVGTRPTTTLGSSIRLVVLVVEPGPASFRAEAHHHHHPRAYTMQHEKECPPTRPSRPQFDARGRPNTQLTTAALLFFTALITDHQQTETERQEESSKQQEAAHHHHSPGSLGKKSKHDEKTHTILQTDGIPPLAFTPLGGGSAATTLNNKREHEAAANDSLVVVVELQKTNKAYIPLDCWTEEATTQLKSYTMAAVLVVVATLLLGATHDGVWQQMPLRRAIIADEVGERITPAAAIVV